MPVINVAANREEHVEQWNAEASELWLSAARCV